MSATTLDVLESDIEALLNQHEKLQFENLSLKQKLASILKDRSLLEAKNAKAAATIRQMIGLIEEELA